MNSTANTSEDLVKISEDYVLYKNKFLGKGAFGNLYLGKLNFFILEFEFRFQFKK